MRLNNKVIYAVNALIELANAKAIMTTDEIAKAKKIPHRYLVQILFDLKKAGIIESFRGSHVGGHKLAKKPHEISCAGIQAAVHCIPNILDKSPGHGYGLTNLSNCITLVLQSITLAQLMRDDEREIK